jgi:steroid 5-alpha reductase family enzyme
MTFIGPLTITLSIVKVSGIALRERQYAGNAAFQDSAWRTGIFSPCRRARKGEGHVASN